MDTAPPRHVPMAPAARDGPNAQRELDLERGAANAWAARSIASWAMQVTSELQARIVEENLALPLQRLSLSLLQVRSVLVEVTAANENVRLGSLSQINPLSQNFKRTTRCAAVATEARGVFVCCSVAST